jgi:ABC-type glycerol-3-phosphate transport system substrate-binding protein
MRQRLAALIAVAAIVGGACSGGAASPSSATQAPGSQPAPSPSTAASTAPTTISIWILQESDKNVQAALEVAVKGYEAANNAKVEVTSYPYLELQDKLLLAAASGAAPDVLYLDQIWVAGYAGANYVTPIDDLMAGADIKKEDYFPGAWDSAFYQGKQWGVPFDVGVWAVLYYNKDMFQAAGLDPNRPPTTWAELKADAAALTKPPKQYGFASWFGIGGAELYIHDAWAMSGGGEIVDPATNKAVLNQPPSVNALQFYKDMEAYGPVGTVGRDEEAGLTLFTAGQAAMVLYGEWGPDTIESRSPGLNYGVALLPVPAAGDKSVGALGGFDLGISSKSQHKDLAWKLIQYLTNTNIQKMGVSSLTPSNRQAAKGYLEAKRGATNGAVMYQQLDQSRVPPLVPNWAEFSDIWRSADQKALLGILTPQQAMDEAAVQIDALLAQ